MSRYGYLEYFREADFEITRVDCTSRNIRFGFFYFNHNMFEYLNLILQETYVLNIYILVILQETYILGIYILHMKKHIFWTFVFNTSRNIYFAYLLESPDAIQTNIQNACSMRK